MLGTIRNERTSGRACLSARTSERGRRGFTLLELLVAVALLGIITVYLLESFTVNQKAYTVVDQVAETQQNTRALGDLIERDIRHAGFMVPAQAAVCAVDNTNTRDLVYLSDADAIDPGTMLTPTMGASFGGANVTAGLNNLVLTSLDLDGDPTYDSDSNGVLDGDFQLNGGVIVVDRANPGRGAACGNVNAINTGTNTVQVFIESNPLGPAGGPTDLIAVPAHEYRIDGFSNLQRDGLILATDVEDLQIAVLIDDDGDFVDDAPGEYRGDGVSPDYDPAEPGANFANLLEVRVNVVVRTRNQDEAFVDGQFQATENRVAVAGNDGFRRRVQTSSGRLRNVMTRTQL